jgi:16S rRNA (adenine1518-N6/adenine1519-N6)-dimethyltransferase
VEDEQVFATLVRQAFAQRRKTLRNTLRELLDAGEISAAGVDPSARAETLTLNEFAALANRAARRT